MTLFQITSLRHKFLLGTAAGLLTLSLALIGLAAALYQHQLTQERSQASREVNRLLQAALENAMLKRDLPGLREIVNQMGQQSGIRGAMIVAPNGEIRFASDPSQLGRFFPLHMLGICQDCPPPTPPETSSQSPSQSPPITLNTQFTVDKQGREVMRSFNPVANKPVCTGCHGSIAAQPINGVLVVDYDAAPIRRQAILSAISLAGMGGVLLLATLLGGVWFIRRYVLLPVARLAHTSRALAAGHMESRSHLSGHDELADLGHTFDQMAESLQNLIRRTREQEAFLQALVDAIPDGIRVIDSENFNIVLDNRAYRDQIGLQPAQSHAGTPCHVSSQGLATPCPPSMVFCPLHEIGKNGQTCKSLMKFSQAEGGERQVEVFAAPLRAQVEGVEKHFVVESIRDLAKLLKFSQEQKLAEMARLATGVAHEIHNPLASIRLALHAMMRATEPNTEPNTELKTKPTPENDTQPGTQQPAMLREYLQMVDGEIDRCINVTERLLKLGITPQATAQLVAVNPAVEETLSLLAWEAGEDQVSIRTQLEIPTPRIMATDSELRAVVLNLAQNAIHAMPQGGRLSVSTRQDGEQVEIVFEDTGVGITAEDAPHVFDPFFSHRADGQNGTGLGLSICRSIIEGYGGKIEFDSQPGRGSRFVVRLPEASTRLSI
jgi:signal transduction histidine kinase/PAS domain-containing protein